MFTEIASHCKANNLRCSFYVDDIAISGRGARASIGPIRAIIGRSRKSIRRSKTEIMPRKNVQVVGNVVVNHRLSNTAERLDSILEAIQAQSRSNAPSARTINRIRGQIAYSKWINKDEGDTLEKLIAFLLPDGDRYAIDEEPVDGLPDVKQPCWSRETCKWATQSRHYS